MGRCINLKIEYQTSMQEWQSLFLKHSEWWKIIKFDIALLFLH